MGALTLSERIRKYHISDIFPFLCFRYIMGAVERTARPIGYRLSRLSRLNKFNIDL